MNTKWYAIVACEFAKPIFKFINPSKSVSIDVGITKFCHDSDNHAVDNPLFLNKMLKPLARASRTLSRRQKTLTIGSKQRLGCKYSMREYATKEITFCTSYQQSIRGDMT